MPGEDKPPTQQTRQRKKNKKSRSKAKSASASPNAAAQDDLLLSGLQLPGKPAAEKPKASVAKLGEESSVAICLQVLFPYLLAGMGMVMAGMVLDDVQDLLLVSVLVQVLVSVLVPVQDLVLVSVLVLVQDLVLVPVPVWSLTRLGTWEDGAQPSAVTSARRRLLPAAGPLAGALGLRGRAARPAPPPPFALRLRVAELQPSLSCCARRRSGSAHGRSLRLSLSARSSSVVRTRLMVASLKERPRCSMADLRRPVRSGAGPEASRSRGVWQELSFCGAESPLALRSWSGFPLDECPACSAAAACSASGLPDGFPPGAAAGLLAWLQWPLERSSRRPRPCSCGLPWPSPSPSPATLPLLSGHSGPLDLRPAPGAEGLGILSFSVMRGGGRNSSPSAGDEDGRPADRRTR
ncbi:hypothetical protein EYF80_035982 [Liparis tanakae]|uniref:Solute carrier family 41 member n=1 Tax=Liparis tanakae TaxID=230148 RepID=A0A4Z2GK03_9TELE|nr:hypothetical protein EYF80_035982 [Liparis tanakae]